MGINREMFVPLELKLEVWNATKVARGEEFGSIQLIHACDTERFLFIFDFPGLYYRPSSSLLDKFCFDRFVSYTFPIFDRLPNNLWLSLPG